MSILLTAAEACRFCAFAKGQAESESDRALARTADYFVVPSIGALVPGWILICTNEHRTNFAGTYADPELVNLRLRMAQALSDKFQLPVRMFEHGAVGTGSRTGCGVDHAHIHLLATDADLLGYSPSKDTISWKPASALSLDSQTMEKEYLYYASDALQKDPAGHIGYPVQPTSQFFRRAIANALDRAEEFDYRTHPHLPNALKTSSALRAT